MALFWFIWLALRPISKAEAAYGWWEIMNLLPPIAYFVVPAITDWTTSFDFIWFAVVPAILLLIAGIKLQYRLEKYEAKQVELLFDPSRFPSCRMQEERTLGVMTTIYRVGLRAVGRRTVDARIQLLRFMPQNANFLPQPLNPMNIPVSGGGWVTVNPSQEPNQFINVVEWTPGEEIAICYHRGIGNRRQWPNTIPLGVYTFTLSVEVRDGATFEQNFTVNAEEGELVLSRT
jgi:hypothetical protein